MILAISVLKRAFQIVIGLILLVSHLNAVAEINIDELSAKLLEISAGGEYRPGDSTSIELEKIKMVIDDEKPLQKNSPRYWYLLGQWYKAASDHKWSALANTKFKQNKTLANHDPSVLKLVEKSHDAYIYAIKLDKDFEPHLSPDMYDRQLHWLPLEYKIIAFEKGVNAGGIGESESDIWDQYWGLVSNLAKAGQFDEAQAVLDEMYAKMKAAGYYEEDDANYLSIAEDAKKDLEKARTKFYEERPEELNKKQKVEPVTEQLQTDSIAERSQADQTPGYYENVGGVISIVDGAKKDPEEIPTEHNGEYPKELTKKQKTERVAEDGEENLKKPSAQYYEEQPEELVKKQVSKEQSKTEKDTVTKRLETKVDPYVSDKSKIWRLILISALVFIGLAVIIYIFRRPRK